ncbi:MAG: adenylate/guanylate cyclase domain-containing protein [Alteraurantiacibacter sp.]
MVDPANMATGGRAMVEDRIRRKLAAILALDVVGFSKLMHADDAAAFALVRRLGSEIFAPCIAAFSGTIFKHTGDGVLARFDSVHDAFEAAERIIAQVIAGGEASLRIGIHLGDVIADHGDVFGDSVNIACRLESLALHNGICISERAWSDLRQRKVDFRDLGVQQLKNIETPIRVYLYDPSGAGDYSTATVSMTARQASQAAATRTRRLAIGGGVLLAAVIAGLALLQPWADSPQSVLDRTVAAVPCSWLVAQPLEETPSRLVSRVGGYTNLLPERVSELVLGALADKVAGDLEVDVAGVITIPELECGFVEAAAQYKYTGVPRAELVRTLASDAAADLAGKLPPDTQVIYDVRVFTSDFPANAELFAIDANDGLQHVAAVSDIKAGDEEDTGSAGGVRHALIWSNSTDPILFFIVSGDNLVAREHIQASYRDAASIRAFHEAAEAGNWQLELILLHHDGAVDAEERAR